MPKKKTFEQDIGIVRVKIIDAINRPKYKARTIQGIVKDTQLSRNVVVNAIRNDTDLKGSLKVYPRRTKNGHVLITTKQKFDKEASFRDKFIDAFATVRTGVEDVY